MSSNNLLRIPLLSIVSVPGVHHPREEPAGCVRHVGGAAHLAGNHRRLVCLQQGTVLCSGALPAAGGHCQRASTLISAERRARAVSRFELVSSNCPCECRWWRGSSPRSRSCPRQTKRMRSTSGGCRCGAWVGAQQLDSGCAVVIGSETCGPRPKGTGCTSSCGACCGGVPGFGPGLSAASATPEAERGSGRQHGACVCCVWDGSDNSDQPRSQPACCYSSSCIHAGI